jgi:hypothetical protein
VKGHHVANAAANRLLVLHHEDLDLCSSFHRPEV